MLLKMKCVRCKADISGKGFKMTLQMGPRGFRRYATCLRCAEKLSVKVEKEKV